MRVTRQFDSSAIGLGPTLEQVLMLSPFRIKFARYRISRDGYS